MRLHVLAVVAFCIVHAVTARSAEAQSADEIPPPPGAAPQVVVATPQDPNSEPPPVLIVAPPPPAYELPPPPPAYGGPAYDQTGVLVSGAAIAAEETRPRRGFALTLGQGIGFALGGSARGAAVDFNLGLGGYVTPNFALMWRLMASGTVSDRRSAAVVGMLIAGESWVSDRFMMGYGVGVGAVESGSGVSSDQTRFVFQARAGYAFAHWSGHSLLGVVNLHGGSASDALVGILTVSFEWQMH